MSDDANRLTSVTNASSGGTTLSSFSYGYNADGQRTSVTEADGSVVSFGYDGQHHLTSETRTGTHPYSKSYVVDGVGNRTSQTVGGTTTTFTLDTDDELTATTGGVVNSYGYNANGEQTSRTLSGTANTLAYDYDGQLTSITSGGATTSFQYDALGRRISRTSGGTTTQFLSNSVDGHVWLESVGGTITATYTWGAGLIRKDGEYPLFDGLGSERTVTNSSQTVTYDAEDRLTSFGAVLTAGYRGDGLRAWKQTSAGRTYFFYDGAKVLFETDATGAITAQNTWGSSALLARTSGGRTLMYTFDPFGNLAEQIDSSTGTVVAAYTFDAYGTRGYSSGDNAALADPYSGRGGALGYYTDWETGLQLLGHRYYDSAGGRFLNRDPAGYVGSINVYEYVSNSPLGQSDSAGLFSLGDAWKCMGNVPKIADCAGELFHFFFMVIVKHGEGWKSAACSAAYNCGTSGVLDCMFEGIFTGVNPILAGCLAGAAAGLVHTILGALCDMLTQ